MIAKRLRTGVQKLVHPAYTENEENWLKWRLTYRGGTKFLRKYLKKFSSREDDQSFKERRAVSYVPAFAKAAVEEVKNSIFQRLTDIIRDGGPASYQAAVEGYDGGVDRHGSDMTTFMGRDVLPELLTMARVGVYVDMPHLAPGATLAEKGDHERPYLYWYPAEAIRSWAWLDSAYGDPTEFRAVLLQDTCYNADAAWDLPSATSDRYRYVWIGDDGFVHVQFYRRIESEASTGGFAGAPGANGVNVKSEEWNSDGKEVTLTIRRIPFVMLSLSDSLLSDVADYQIALLNLASSDISYALKSNYPFFTEQYDWKTELTHAKPPVPGGMVATSQSMFDPSSSTVLVAQEKSREVRVGTTSGRRYPIGTERPGFIHPSSEPLSISMAKQEQLKTEIRQLVHLAVSTLSSTRQSAESMGMDNQGLEAGLSYVALEMQHAERKIADFWAMYEDGAVDGAAVNYPTQYSILSDEDRRAAAAELTSLLPMVSSLTFRREVSKRIVDVVLGSKVRQDVLRKIKAEIDSDPVVIGDPAVIESDVVNGLVDLETASAARGYPKGVVALAKVDHAERLARIASSQAAAAMPPGSDPGARGVPDLSANPKAGVQEKTASQTDQTSQGDVKPRVRGEAK